MHLKPCGHRSLSCSAFEFALSSTREPVVNNRPLTTCRPSASWPSPLTTPAFGKTDAPTASHRDGSPTKTVSSSIAPSSTTGPNSSCCECLGGSLCIHRLLGVDCSLPGFDLPPALLLTTCSLLSMLRACRLLGYVFLANFGTLASGGATCSRFAASVVPLGDPFCMYAAPCHDRYSAWLHICTASLLCRLQVVFLTVSHT